MESKITVTCPCGKALSAPADKAGKQGKCPVCGKVFVIPARSRRFPAWLFWVCGVFAVVVVLSLAWSTVQPKPPAKIDRLVAAQPDSIAPIKEPTQTNAVKPADLPPRPQQKPQPVKTKSKDFVKDWNSKGIPNPGNVILSMQQDDTVLCVKLKYDDWTDIGAAAMKNLAYTIARAFNGFMDEGVSVLFFNHIGREIAEATASMGEVEVELK